MTLPRKLVKSSQVCPVYINKQKNLELWKRIGGGNHEVETKELPPSLTAIVCKVYVSALSSMLHLRHEIISGLSLSTFSFNEFPCRSLP